MNEYARIVLRFWCIVIVTISICGTVLGCCAMHEGYSYHEDRR